MGVSLGYVLVLYIYNILETTLSIEIRILYQTFVFSSMNGFCSTKYVQNIK